MSTTDTEHHHTGPWVRQGVDGRDYCQTCGPDWPGREHFPGGVYETADTERDERLREAREAATRARTQNPPLGIETWLITLDAEVTRLDAVVTEQAATIQRVEGLVAAGEEAFAKIGVPGAVDLPAVRLALEGGAS